MSLAVKYRPQTFDEVLGQDHVKVILQKQLDTNTIKNTYLFCGPSGDGKTTIARILANKINNGQGQPIEIDAASNNGVENIRSIIEDAKQRSIDSEYKIFVVDECFEGDTLVKTESGYKKIRDIKIGESVATLTGFNKVTNVFENKVENNMLNYLNLSNGKRILCTKDHLFFTTQGWIPCKNLVKGDELIVYSNLSELWKENSNISKGSEILLQQMPTRIEKEECWSKACDTKSLSDLWKHICNIKEIGSKENLFKGLSSKINIAIRKDSKELRVWDGHKEISFKKNVSKQSNEKSRECRKNEINEGPAWNTPSIIQNAWRKWTLYETTDDVIQQFARFMDIRISNKNELLGIQSEPLCCSVQSRPWLSREDASDRGGWQFPSLEKEYCSRYQKREMSERVRVESVEIYESADRSKPGMGDSGYTTVYDLSVETNPTYFVNDILVHNCHMISTAGWNAFLKCIEEPPKYTIFMFCTTNPEKIPATIINRCMRFNLSRVSTELIKQRLEYISEKEGFTNYSEACDFIAKISNGGVRDAISNLEKCADYSNDLDIKNILAALGNYSYEEFFDLTNCLIDGKEGDVLAILNHFFNSGKDVKLFIDQYLQFTLDLTKYSIFKDIKVTKLPSSLEKDLKYATSIENAVKYFNKLVEAVLDIKNTIRNDPSASLTIQAMFIKIMRT